MFIQLTNSTDNYCPSSVSAAVLFARGTVYNLTLCLQKEIV